MTGPTPSQTIGPFFGPAMDWIDEGPVGVTVHGTVLDGAGDPVPDAVLETWHPNAGFARGLTGADGIYRLRTVKPHPGTDRHAPHLAVSLFARGLLQRLVTRIYFPDEPAANGADPVLNSIDASRRETLIAIEDGAGLRFDVRLQGERETVFFAW